MFVGIDEERNEFRNVPSETHRQHQRTPFKGLSTIAIHSGQNPEQWESGPVVEPIVTSTSFKRCHGERTVSGVGMHGTGMHEVGMKHERAGKKVEQWSMQSGHEVDTDSMRRSVGYYDGKSFGEELKREEQMPYGRSVRETRKGGDFGRDKMSTLPTLHGQLEYNYGRNTNPTRTTLEKCLANLENANYAITLSSGNAALTVLNSLLKTGDHVLIIDEVYVDTKRFFEDCATRMGITSSFVDMNNLNETVREVTPNTRMVWIETPTNPSLKIVDIKAIVDGVKRKQPKAIIVVDNTIATPVFQRPLELGADIVLHSLSKYINGHIDVVMGALVTNDEELFKNLKMLQDILGVTPSPFDCYLVNRGIKTLTLRMKEHQNSALKVANVLESNPNVTRVVYPGLRSHKHHDLFNKQMRGFGGVVGLKVKGSPREVEKFLDSLKLVQCAESLGGYASLIEQPDRELTERGLEAKYGENFLRLSIGLEDVDDIIYDLTQALNKMKM